MGGEGDVEKLEGEGVPMDYLGDESVLAHFYVTCSLEQLFFLKKVIH